VGAAEVTDGDRCRVASFGAGSPFLQPEVTMIHKLALVLLAAAGLLLASVPSPAQKDKDEEAEQANEKIRQERMKTLITAHELAAEGYKRDAPEYLITAAGMLLRLSALKDLQAMKKFDEKPEITGPGDSEQDKEAKLLTLRELSDKWFKDASDMGASVPGVDALIKLVKKRETTDKGDRDALVGGPRHIAMKIGPGKTHTYNFEIFTHKHTLLQFQATHPLRVIVTHAAKTGGATWLDEIATHGGADWYPFGWNPQGYAKVPKATITIRIMNITNKTPAHYQMIIQ
jgi:hypothetical protein